MYTRTLAVLLAAAHLVACGGSDAPAPTISRFSADRTTVGSGDRVTLSYEVSNATNVTIAGPSGELLSSANATGSVETPPLTANSAFTLTARNADGASTTARVEITVDTSMTRIGSFVADPATIGPGDDSTLRWSITGRAPDLVRIVDSGGVEIHSGTMASGSETVSPATTETYRLLVSAGSAMLEASATVTVNAIPPQILTLVATPNPAPRGTQGTLSWTTANALEVQVSRDATVIRPWSTNGAASGFVQLTFDLPSATYKLEARNGFSTVEQVVVVTTNPVATIESFTATPAEFTGTSTTAVIRWSVRDADTVELLLDGAAVPMFPGTATGELSLEVDRTIELTLIGRNPATEDTAVARVARKIPFTARVVTGPRDAIAGLPNVAVRVAATGRASTLGFEGTTDMNGDALVLVDDNAFPVDLTVARPLYGAVSIVGLTGSLAEPIRLDLPEDLPFMEAPINGAVSGKMTATNDVVIDAPFFNTVQSADATYQTSYVYGGTGPQLPVFLIAVELDAAGDPINGVVTASVARTGAPLQIDVPFPSPPVAPVTTDVRVVFPASGVFPNGPLNMPRFSVEERYESSEAAFTFAGTSRTTFASALELDWQMRSYTSGFGSPLGLLAVDDGFMQVIVETRTFGVPQVITIGEVRTLELPTGGSALRDARFNVDATDYDVLIADIGESSGVPPAWRVFFNVTQPLTGGIIPQLPTTVPASALGLTNNESCLFILSRMEDGVAAWSEPASAFVGPRIRYMLAGVYETYSLAGL